jgi:xylan 1,4-beta-xylosidase
MKLYNLSGIILSAGIILLNLSCGNKQQTGAPMIGNAIYEWFEYQGYDPLYESLEPTANEYINPILAGFYPDPSIEKVGDDYYLVNSSFGFFPAIPIFHSNDLVNWTQLGHVLDRPEQTPFDSIGTSRGIFAPALSYHDGIYYLVCTLVDCGGNFVVTAKNPAGPWSNPKLLYFEGIDPSLFFDDDGKAYLVNNGAPEGEPLYNGHRAIWMQEFDTEKLEMTGPRRVIVNGGTDISKKPVWIEGPHIYKINNMYYLSAAEGGTSTDHSQVIFRSKIIWGPYHPWDKNPILSQRHLSKDRPDPVTCTGHMDMVETAKGEWWAVFLGCTPYEENFFNTGRQTFLLPVKWSDDWPYVLSGDEAVPFLHLKPELPFQSSSPVPLNGNFILRDEFSDSTLANIYSFIRTPHEKWFDLKAGNLIIRARNEAIDGLGQPSFIGRRQQHNYCSAITSMRFQPEKNGEKAGLVVFQNEENYYFVGLTMVSSKPVIVLEKGSQKGPVVMASVPFNNRNGKALILKISARGKFYDFYYAVEPDKWLPVMVDTDARYLSTDVAGGFIGAYFGMYAYRPAE